MKRSGLCSGHTTHRGPGCVPAGLEMVLALQWPSCQSLWSRPWAEAETPRWEAGACVSSASSAHHRQIPGKSCSRWPEVHRSVAQTEQAEQKMVSRIFKDNCFMVVNWRTHLVMREDLTLAPHKAAEERHWNEAEEDDEEDRPTDYTLGLRTAKKVYTNRVKSNKRDNWLHFRRATHICFLVVLFRSIPYNLAEMKWSLNAGMSFSVARQPSADSRAFITSGRTGTADMFSGFCVILINSRF